MGIRCGAEDAVSICGASLLIMLAAPSTSSAEASLFPIAVCSGMPGHVTSVTSAPSRLSPSGSDPPPTPPSPEVVGTVAREDPWVKTELVATTVTLYVSAACLG